MYPSLAGPLEARRSRKSSQFHPMEPVVFRARRPAALVIPLGLITEVAGVLCLLSGATIGWFIMAAPVITLAVTALLFRPSLEMNSEGIIQKQHPFVSKLKWETVANLGVVNIGNRDILAYKLAPGIPAPKYQPIARLLKAKELPYDGGYFIDVLAEPAEKILQTAESMMAASIGPVALRTAPQS